MNYRSQTVSAVVLTHNHSASIERCLDSLTWVDEIIVLDYGSTDGTLDIARRYTDKIAFHPASDLNIRRNFAYDLARCDWIISVDPNEWVEEMLRHEIDGVLLNMPAQVAGLAIGRNIQFQSQSLGVTPAGVRLFRKGRGRAALGPYDHKIVVQGDTQRLDRHLGVEPYHNWSDWITAVNDESTQNAYRAIEEGQPASASGALGLIVSAKLDFIQSYLGRGGFRLGLSGLTLAFATMMSRYLTRIKHRSLVRARH